jgi:methylenetetrahydrofolate reductase (NADPH)
MKVIDIINDSKETIFSFEILPPLKGQNIGDIYSNIDPLMEFNPPFINVTYHREEVVYKRLSSGLCWNKKPCVNARVQWASVPL